MRAADVLGVSLFIVMNVRASCRPFSSRHEETYMNWFWLEPITSPSTSILSLIKDLQPSYSLRDPLNLGGSGKMALVHLGLVVVASGMGVDACRNGCGASVDISAGVVCRRDWISVFVASTVARRAWI